MRVNLFQAETNVHKGDCPLCVFFLQICVYKKIDVSL